MTLRVLVSGGGIAGPTFAWFLAQLGTYHITVVEKAPAVSFLNMPVNERS